MSRILLTGATGVVGRSVIPQLLANGAEITVLARQPVQMDRCTTVVGTLENIAQISPPIAGYDAIVHLACSGSSIAKDVVEQDVAGAAGLVDAWTNGPFIHVSTSALYAPQEHPITERAPITPSTWHAFGKHIVEFQLRLAERQNGRAGAVLLRPTLVFARAAGRSGNLLADLCELCRHGTRFVFDSESGMARWGASFIGGGDLGRAITLALKHDLSGSFNIAGGFCTWRELIETINRVTDARAAFAISPGARPGAGEFRLPQCRTEVDTTAFKNATGFQPRETLGEIVEAFVHAEQGRRSA
jgi:nucleoside-diphosphate-sugar epimerase